MQKKCIVCQLPKELETEFSHRTKGSKDGYQNTCKKCHSNYRKGHYLQNKRKYITKASVRTNAVSNRNAEFVFEYLKDKKCIDCEETDSIVLAFDHRDPIDKSFSVSQGIRYLPTEYLLMEILKCDIRCANCHLKKHARENNWRRFRLTNADVL